MNLSVCNCIQYHLNGYVQELCTPKNLWLIMVIIGSLVGTTMHGQSNMLTLVLNQPCLWASHGDAGEAESTLNIGLGLEHATGL